MLASVVINEKDDDEVSYSLWIPKFCRSYLYVELLQMPIPYTFPGEVVRMWC